MWRSAIKRYGLLGDRARYIQYTLGARISSELGEFSSLTSSLSLLLDARDSITMRRSCGIDVMLGEYAMLLVLSSSGPVCLRQCDPAPSSVSIIFEVVYNAEVRNTNKIKN